LGFSLDSDSRLITLQASFTDSRSNNLAFSYHRAEISSPQLAQMPKPWVNVVSNAPVTLNIAEAHLTVPFERDGYRAKLDIVGRVQDDQPRPKHGATGALEVALSFGL
jgi:hypothetical protein